MLVVDQSVRGKVHDCVLAQLCAGRLGSIGLKVERLQRFSFLGKRSDGLGLLARISESLQAHSQFSDRPGQGGFFTAAFIFNNCLRSYFGSGQPDSQIIALKDRIGQNRYGLTRRLAAVLSLASARPARRLRAGLQSRDLRPGAGKGRGGSGGEERRGERRVPALPFAP